MPSAWRQAYDTCPATGQVYEEQLVEGLAAETVIMTGDTACLWNGIVTNAMVEMMITGVYLKIKLAKWLVMCGKSSTR